MPCPSFLRRVRRPRLVWHSDVTLGALAEKLGYTVSSWGLKTATTEEQAVDANITMKEIADIAEGSEVLLIAHNADGTAMGLRR